MGLFEDFSRFLETRLEEFLRNNPHLELQAIDEQLREQEADTLRLIADLQRQEKNTEASILSTAQEVQRWHVRIEKAKTAQRWDLVKPAEEREAALLREGNQLWGQMTGIKDRIQQTKELYKRIQTRRKEVKAKLQEVEAARAAQAAQAARALLRCLRTPRPFRCATAASRCRGAVSTWCSADCSARPGSPAWSCAGSE